MFGSRMAEHYASANESAIREYEKLISEKGIDCDFVRCPAYLYSRTEKQLLKQEADAAGTLGIAATFETECELPFRVAGVTKFENQARFHPLKFLSAIAEETEVMRRIFKNHSGFADVVFVFLLSCVILFLQLN